MSEYKATKTAAGKGKVVDKNGFSVCSCSGGTYADTVKRAEMIALALNNHKRLVEALRNCIDDAADIGYESVYNEGARELLSALEAEKGVSDVAIQS